MSFPAYPSYRASGVEWLGPVPDHWAVDRIKASVASSRNGIWGGEPEGGAEDIICVRVADFDRVRFLATTDFPTMRMVADNERDGRQLQHGDLLLEKSGGGEKQPVGVVVQYVDDVPAVCSNFVARVQLKPGMHSRFWTYVHAGAYSIRLTQGCINQTSGIQNLDSGRYFEERAPFPPLNEQAAIAAFLDRETAKIDALVKEQRRLIELLKEKRQAVISRAVTKGLNPDVSMKDSGVEWLEDVPAHWEVKPLRALFRFVKRQEGRALDVLSVYRDYGVIRKSDRDDNINKTPDDLSGYQTVAPADLVINKMKAWQGSLGVAKIEGIISPDYAVFAALHRCDSDYLNFLLRCQLLPNVYRSISNGIRPDQWRLEPDRFKELLVPVPPDAEQSDVAAFIADELIRTDALALEAGTAISLLQERRGALISAAVTGKIDVRTVVQHAVAA